MSAGDVIAKAAKQFEELPHGLRYGLYDYSSYKGDSEPHIVRNPENEIVYRSYDPDDANLVWKRLTEEHRAQFILSALTAAGYRIVGPGEVDVLQDARKFIARFDGKMPTASEDEGVFALLERIDAALATRPRDEGEK